MSDAIWTWADVPTAEPPPSEPGWTVQKEIKLLDLWYEGRSCSAIARELGVTRNAVIGKAHRLGAPARPSPLPAGSPTKGCGQEVLFANNDDLILPLALQLQNLADARGITLNTVLRRVAHLMQERD